MILAQHAFNYIGVIWRFSLVQLLGLASTNFNTQCDRYTWKGSEEFFAQSDRERESCGLFTLFEAIAVVQRKVPLSLSLRREPLSLHEFIRLNVSHQI